jgi:hypothetical protein
LGCKENCDDDDDDDDGVRDENDEVVDGVSDEGDEEVDDVTKAEEFGKGGKYFDDDDVDRLYFENEEFMEEEEGI